MHKNLGGTFSHILALPRSPRSPASSTILIRTPLTMANLPDGDTPGQVLPGQLLQLANGKVVHLHHTTGFCQPPPAHSPSTGSVEDGSGKPTGGFLGHYQQNMANQMNLLCQLVMDASGGASKSTPTGLLPAPLGPHALLRQGGGAGSIFGDIGPPSQPQPPAPAPFANLKLNFADKTSFFNPYTGRESAASTPPLPLAWAAPGPVSASHAHPHAQPHASNAANTAQFVQFGMRHGIQVRPVNPPSHNACSRSD